MGEAECDIKNKLQTFQFSKVFPQKKSDDL